jgi:hypothetical protein
MFTIAPWQFAMGLFCVKSYSRIKGPFSIGIPDRPDFLPKAWQAGYP